MLIISVILDTLKSVLRTSICVEVIRNTSLWPSHATVKYLFYVVTEWQKWSIKK